MQPPLFLQLLAFFALPIYSSKWFRITNKTLPIQLINSSPLVLCLSLLPPASSFTWKSLRGLFLPFAAAKRRSSISIRWCLPIVESSRRRLRVTARGGGLSQSHHTMSNSKNIYLFNNLIKLIYFQPEMVFCCV